MNELEKDMKSFIISDINKPQEIISFNMFDQDDIDYPKKADVNNDDFQRDDLLEFAAFTD